MLYLQYLFSQRLSSSETGQLSVYTSRRQRSLQPKYPLTPPLQSKPRPLCPTQAFLCHVVAQTVKWIVEKTSRKWSVLISMLSFVLNETEYNYLKKTHKWKWNTKKDSYVCQLFPLFKSEMNDVCVCVDPLDFNSGSSGTTLLGSEVLNRLFKRFLLYVSFGAVCIICRRYCVYYPHWWKGLSSAQIFICGQLIDVNLVIGL